MTNPSPKKPRSLRREVTAEASQRLRSEVSSRREMLKSSTRTQIESQVPEWLRWIIPLLESFRGNAEDTAPEATPDLADLPATSETVSAASRLTDNPCLSSDRNPVTCQAAQTTRRQNPLAGHCRECGFSLLLDPAEKIAGKRGRYQVTAFLGERGRGRLYLAKQPTDDTPVMIKEFLRPDRLERSEWRVRQQMFTRLAGLDAIDGKIQDYRLVVPWEAIADVKRDRCYLVSKGTWDSHLTLATYLKQHGVMTDGQVRRVLDQVLQTLEFLHGQKVRSPEGLVSEAGLAHGKLSLESLLLIHDNKSTPESVEERLNPLLPLNFFIYVCDLALWENLFDITVVPQDFYLLSQQSNFISSQEKLKQAQKADLKALGAIGYALLTGEKVLPDMAQIPSQRHPCWLAAHPILQTVIRRLLEIDASPPYETATLARQQLRQMPVETVLPATDLDSDPTDQTPRFPRWLWWLLGGASLGVVFWLVSSLLPKPQPQAIARNTTLTCTMSEVTGVPVGRFRYMTDANGSWNNLLKQNKLLSRSDDLSPSCPRRRETDITGNIVQIVESRQTPSEPPARANQPAQSKPTGKIPAQQLQFALEHTPLTDQKNATALEQAIAQVKDRYSAFTVTTLADNLPVDLTSQTIAYDGIAIIVSFSYAKRDNGLPKKLNGQVSLTNLRKLYTGQIRNWKEIGGPDLPVSLYAPNDEESVRLFEKLVFTQAEKTSDEKVREFRRLLSPPTASNTFVQLGTIPRLPIGKLLQRVISDFENEQPQRGAIAFAPLSRVFGQCSVYPLAIGDDKNAAIQPLIQDNGSPVDPNTDLCRNKGSYRPAIALFQTRLYPLAYDLSVIYRRDNSLPPVGEKFADMLRTQEGQALLQQTGLIPIAEIKDGRRE